MAGEGMGRRPRPAASARRWRRPHGPAISTSGASHASRRPGVAARDLRRDRRAERRHVPRYHQSIMTIRPPVPLPIVFVVASAAVFLVALAVVHPFGVTFDEAKYLGIGYSMIEGQGPQTVFGGYFLPHGPVWPTVVVAPAVALGIDPLIVGRILNALAAVGLILLSAALAWRVSPTAAAFAAIALLATTYFHELTRTARLDVPAATLAVAYLALGLVAVRRGSARTLHRGRSGVCARVPGEGDRPAARAGARADGDPPSAAMASDAARRRLVDHQRDRRRRAVVRVRRGRRRSGVPPRDPGLDAAADRSRPPGGRGRCRDRRPRSMRPRRSQRLDDTAGRSALAPGWSSPPRSSGCWR